MVADLVVLPCGPSTLDAWALAESVELVQAAKERRPNLRAVVVINRQNPRTGIGASARESLAELGLPVATSELCMRVAFAEAPAAGVGVTRFAVVSTAAAEVRALVDELTKLAVPEKRKAKNVTKQEGKKAGTAGGNEA
jgi:chromosome partitioning protein